MPLKWRLQRHTLGLRRVRSRRTDRAFARIVAAAAMQGDVPTPRPHRKSAKADCVPL
jgi:hypothetical protein